MAELRILQFRAASNTPSETFVDDHARCLPGQVQTAYGFPPRVDGLFRLDGTIASVFCIAKSWLSGSRPQGDKFGDWVTSICLAEILKKGKFDVVLAEYGTHGAQIMEACRQQNIPLVVHFHGFDASVTSVLEEFRDAYKRMFAIAKAIVVVSDPMRQRLLELGAPENKLRRTCYGIDCKKYGGAEPENSSIEFLSVGRFVEKKAPHMTLFAFQQLVDSFPEAKLKMIGDGTLLPICRDLARQLKIENHVTFMGAQSRASVQSEMKLARAFVQHSVCANNGDREGTPVAILEAGASGLPVVATRHEGIPDAVIDGHTGFLVEENDVNSMATALEKLARDKVSAGRLGRAGRDHIQQNFSQEMRIAELANILQMACS